MEKRITTLYRDKYNIWILEIHKRRQVGANNIHYTCHKEVRKIGRTSKTAYKKRYKLYKYQPMRTEVPGSIPGAVNKHYISYKIYKIHNTRNCLRGQKHSNSVVKAR